MAKDRGSMCIGEEGSTAVRIIPWDILNVWESGGGQDPMYQLLESVTMYVGNEKNLHTKFIGYTDNVMTLYPTYNMPNLQFYNV